MRKLALLLLAFFCAGSATQLACSDDTSGDAGPEDVGQRRDIPRDVVVPVDAWTSEWDNELTLEVFDDTPCEPWEPIAPLPRGLPADVTPGEPRVLWYYYAEDDPRYEGTWANFDSRADHFTLGFDGGLWMHGPSRGHLTKVNREGQMERWIVSPTTSDGEALGRMMPLPDGTLLISTYREGSGPRGGGLLRLPAEDVREPPANLRAPEDGFDSRLSALQLALRGSPSMAMAGDGMVYIGSADKVHGTCKGERLMWTVTETRAPRVPQREPLLRTQDGTLLLDYTHQRAYRVSPTGEVAVREDIMPDLGYENVVRAVGAVTPRVEQEYANGIIELVTGSSAHRFTEGGTGLLVANEDFWYAALDYSWVRRYSFPSYEDYLEVDVVDVPYANSEWLDDGGYIRWHQTEASLVRYSRDAEELWRFDPVRPDYANNSEQYLPTTHVFDDQGVLYLRLRYRLGEAVVAIQTDALPPASDVCLTYECNGRRDGWIRTGE